MAETAAPAPMAQATEGAPAEQQQFARLVQAHSACRTMMELVLAIDNAAMAETARLHARIEALEKQVREEREVCAKIAEDEPEISSSRSF